MIMRIPKTPKIDYLDRFSVPSPLLFLPSFCLSAHQNGEIPFMLLIKICQKPNVSSQPAFVLLSKAGQTQNQSAL